MVLYCSNFYHFIERYTSKSHRCVSALVYKGCLDDPLQPEWLREQASVSHCSGVEWKGQVQGIILSVLVLKTITFSLYSEKMC